MAITPRPLAPAEDWQRISVPPDTKHDSLKRFLWYYYHWTKLPCDIFWMTSIERYQCEDLIALHQSINIFRMISNVPFQHYNQKIIIKSAKKKKQGGFLLCKCCGATSAIFLKLANSAMLIGKPASDSALSKYFACSVPDKAWQAGWRCFGAWPKRNHLLFQHFTLAKGLGSVLERTLNLFHRAHSPEAAAISLKLSVYCWLHK